MKRVLIPFLLLASSLGFGQCSSNGSGTSCPGPLTVTAPAGNTQQSSIILVDLSLPAPQPAASQYIVSIINGVLQESDSGGTYHTLTGPQGVPGPAGQNGQNGAPGQAATVQVGTVTSGTPAAINNTGTQSAAILNFVIPPGPQGPPGVVVGNVITITGVTINCPKGKGTVPAGYVSTNCTISGTISNMLK